MEEKLEFSLPEKKQRASVATLISIVLLLALVGLALVNLLVNLSARRSEPDAAIVARSAERRL